MPTRTDAPESMSRRRFLHVAEASLTAAGALVATVADSAEFDDGARARKGRCAADLQDAAHPPMNVTSVLLRVLEPSIEPVPNHSPSSVRTERT